MSKSHDDPMKRNSEAGGRHDVMAGGPTEASNASAAAAALEASEVEIGKLRADLEDASDRVLRAQAELENYRKRVRREMDDERRYATLPLLRDLLPVIDNVQRAIAAAEKLGASGGLLDGVKLIGQSLVSTLERHDCRKIEALHKHFDPAFHEAISQQATGEYPPNTVVLVAQDGFMLHDRVVRPAQVIVSKSTE
jgi:molecular chaperone GrpE